MNADIWVEPAYMGPLRATVAGFEKLSACQIEHKLAAMPGVESLTGLSNHEHRRRAMARMFPSRVDHPWRERVLLAYARCRAERIKELMLLGSSNSTKTSSLADLIVEIWMECAQATTIYITSPYDDATETGVWARVVEQFEEAKANCPELPGRLKVSQKAIVQFDNNPLSFIKAVSVDRVGKLVGKKAKIFTIGVMLIVADELPEFPQQGAALVSVMDNLISVPNMLLIGAGNFASPQDALGVFAEPDMPGGYADLRLHEHYEWRSKRGGLVLRFDGDQSPGLEDPIKFNFLPTEEYRAQLAKQSGGTKSPGYYRYWHSFPLVGSEEFTITNMVKVRASAALSERYEWTAAKITRGGNVDPGFGGDAAILQPWRMGFVREPDGSDKQVFEAHGPPILIPIDVESPLTAEEQIVDFHRAWAERENVPAEHCSFDGSMRASIVQEYARRWSVRVAAIDSGGQATDRLWSVIKEFNPRTGQEQKRAVKCNEVFDNLITEFWAMFATALIGRQIRGLVQCPASVKQLCSRTWEWVGKHKKKLQTKKKYKLANGQQSPNEADALIGGMEMARRLGFRVDVQEGEKRDAVSVLKKMAEDQMARGVLLPHQRARLPSGRLHATARTSLSRNVRHNR